MPELEKMHRKYGGYPWFAWYPVKLDGKWVWLKTVWVIGIDYLLKQNPPKPRPWGLLS